MIKTAVFDLDGTLLDTVPDLTAAMNNAMDVMGRSRISVEEARAYIGNGIKKFAIRALTHNYDGEAADEEADAAVAVFKKYYAEHLTDHTAVYPGVRELLDKLKADGIKLAVLSNKYESATQHIISVFFPGVFEAVHGESEICKRKPDISGLMLICDELGCAPEECVMIGDSPTDYNVAVNAGARPVSVEWGYRSRERLAAYGAAVFAGNAAQLYDIIRSL